MTENGEIKKLGTLYLVGVGPGDPELITMKGIRVLKSCDVWLAPKAHNNGASSALTIAEKAIGRCAAEILTHRFPMKQIHRNAEPDAEVDKAWNDAAQIIVGYLKKGQDVAFPTLGDPAVYSTAFYVCEALNRCNPEVAIEVIPGVSAIGATSAVAQAPLCLGNEHLVVIPATFKDDRIREILRICDAVAFMKVHRVMPKLIELLDEFGLVDRAILVEKTTLEDQRIWHDIREAEKQELHYFSTMIVRK